MLNQAVRHESESFPQYPQTPRYAQVRFVYVSSHQVIYNPLNFHWGPSVPQVWQSRGAYLGLHPSFIPFKPWSISLGYPFKSRGCPLWTFSCMSCTGLPLLFLYSSGLFHAIHSWRMYSLMNCLKKITRVWSKFANYRECPRSVIATFLKDVK